MSALATILGQVTYEISSGGIPAWLIIFWLVFGIGSYVFQAYCQMVMAQKMNMEYPWFAWIPFLNFYLMWQMSGRDTNWLIFLILSLFICAPVFFVLYIILWMDIAAARGFEKWWGIMIIIPLFNYYVMWKLAFEN